MEDSERKEEKENECVKANFSMLITSRDTQMCLYPRDSDRYVFYLPFE